MAPASLVRRNRWQRARQRKFNLSFPFPADCICGDGLWPHVRLCPRYILPRLSERHTA